MSPSANGRVGQGWLMIKRDNTDRPAFRCSEFSELQNLQKLIPDEKENSARAYFQIQNFCGFWGRVPTFRSGRAAEMPRPDLGRDGAALAHN